MDTMFGQQQSNVLIVVGTNRVWLYVRVLVVVGVGGFWSEWKGVNIQFNVVDVAVEDGVDCDWNLLNLEVGSWRMV